MKVIDAKNVEELLTSLAMVPNVIIEKWLNEHTVKAIPVEWILKWACEFIDPNSEGYKMAMELVHDWRKENEHKESD